MRKPLKQYDIDDIVVLVGRIVRHFNGQVMMEFPHEEEGKVEWSVVNSVLARKFEEAAALRATELERWWAGIAASEAEKVAPKAYEYGSRDLLDIGHDMARILGVDWDDRQAAEAGTYFYVRGKLARWTAALERGEDVSMDTLADIGVYVRMAQRIRTHGGWPGSEEAL